MQGTGSSPARHAVVLAAGKGTRMQSDLPKVAMPMNGRAMILHVLDRLLPLHLESITLVVGYRREVVEDLAARWQSEQPGRTPIHFALQAEQKGTAHAFLQAEPSLSGKRGLALVTAGDMPLLRPSSFDRLFASAASNEMVGAVLSAELENPKGYGRMVRDTDGSLARIVEEKDADEATKALHEVNTGCYVFRIPEIFQILKQIDSNNKQNEYYLPDAIRIYRERKERFGCILLDDAHEAMGANTVEDLARLEEIHRTMKDL